ncbi:MAG: efflux RND transporter permease subunit, partial [Planctomycetaceae bacterium]|nr:efflux RND transporter permease subunit [Planctomycetaceae bacterium]
LGVAVFSGMLGVTLFGLFFTPMFYVAVTWVTERFRRAGPAPNLAADTTTAPARAEPGA